MARFNTTIASPLPPDEAFARMAAFDRVPEWDPATEASVRVGDETGKGAAFDVTTTFGGKTHVIRYTMSEHDPPRRFVLDARMPNGFALRDEITVAPGGGGGSLVTYDAVISPRGIWKLAAPILQRVFTRIGAKAIPGLRSYLDAQ